MANRFGRDMVCTRCLESDLPRLVKPGSIFIELVLWMAFLLPGLLYSLWRISRQHDACQHCGSTELVETDSPRGIALLRQAEKTE